jgi:hypothetical protein
MTVSLSPMEALVFGQNAKRHPITDMILEQGNGALPPDEQARIIHLPRIAATQGPAIAAAMLAKLNGGAGSAPDNSLAILREKLTRDLAAALIVEGNAEAARDNALALIHDLETCLAAIPGAAAAPADSGATSK